MDGLDLSSDFQLFQSHFETFEDWLKCTIYNWYHRYFYVLQHFKLSSEVQIFVSLFVFFDFYSVVCRDGKVHKTTGFTKCLFWFWLKVHKNLKRQNETGIQNKIKIKTKRSCRLDNQMLAVKNKTPDVQVLSECARMICMLPWAREERDW